MGFDIFKRSNLKSAKSSPTFTTNFSCIKGWRTDCHKIASQQHHATNKILNELASEEPFQSVLQKWERIFPLLEIDEYAALLFENGGSDIVVYEKIYPLVLQDYNALFDWVSGTALIPYLEKLDTYGKKDFILLYKNDCKISFKSSRHSILSKG